MSNNSTTNLNFWENNKVKEVINNYTATLLAHYIQLHRALVLPNALLVKLRHDQAK